LLDKDIIAPAHGPYSSPALLVPKKHKPGETNIHKLWRFVSDYRALNAVTVTDNYRPPPIDMLIGATAGAKYYSFLDLEKGFWQLPIAEESQPATAFTIPGIGVYQFKRVVMGLKNSSAVFQRHIDRVLVGLTFRICVAFIDDICIYSKSIEDHKTHLAEVFARLLRHGHSLRLDKCSFFQVEHEFLGYIISEGGIKPSPRLASGLTSLGYPTSLKELRAWIGMMNYQRRFIKNFAEKIAPLHDAVKAGANFRSLTHAEKEAFDSLRDELKAFWEASQLLYFPDWSRPIEIETDASRKAIAGWAFQVVDGERRPIAYVSRSVTDAEKKYCDLLGIHEGTGFETRQIETLAIIYVLEELSHLLEGAEHVTVRTDHRNIL
jgi:cleavage and polyadenylation specificity factor subunit 1